MQKFIKQGFRCVSVSYTYGPAVSWEIQVEILGLSNDIYHQIDNQPFFCYWYISASCRKKCLKYLKFI